MGPRRVDEVLGTVGLERHSLRFTGQAAHAGSTPLPMRRDAFLAAAEQEALPKNPVQLARKMFAQVFSGVHW